MPEFDHSTKAGPRPNETDLECGARHITRAVDLCSGYQ